MSTASENPYILGVMTSQGVAVKKLSVSDSLTRKNYCECCRREVWCGGYTVCFECSTNDCESVHPEMMAEVPE